MNEWPHSIPKTDISFTLCGSFLYVGLCGKIINSTGLKRLLKNQPSLPIIHIYYLIIPDLLKNNTSLPVKA